jgi:DNA-directed RNA polymerase specialized sigma24 family protein
MERHEIQRKVNSTGETLAQKVSCKHDLVNGIVADKEYLRIARKITHGNDLYHDLHQEMLLVILDYNEDYLVRVIEQGSIRFFVVGLMMRMYRSKSSPFYMKYRQGDHLSALLDIDADVTYDTTDDDTIEKVRALISDLPWYDAMLFEAYIREGSTRKLSAKTNIPRDTIRVTVANVRKKILSKL